jgi:hypothetical protein
VEDTNLFLRALRLRWGMGNGVIPSGVKADSFEVFSRAHV